MSGGKLALNLGSGLRRFDATFPPDIKRKTLCARLGKLKLQVVLCPVPLWPRGELRQSLPPIVMDLR